MKMHIWVVDVTTDEVLEDCGITLTNNVNGALALYADKEIAWADEGYASGLRYEIVD